MRAARGACRLSRVAAGAFVQFHARACGSGELVEGCAWGDFRQKLDFHRDARKCTWQGQPSVNFSFFENYSLARTLYVGNVMVSERETISPETQPSDGTSQ